MKEVIKWADGTAFKPDEKKALRFYSQGLIAVDKASTVDEAKNIKDVSKRIELYAKQKKNDSLIRQAMAIMTRAERQMGALLIEMQKNGQRTFGGRPGKTNSKKELVSRAELKDLGITAKESMEAQRLANMPESLFEERTEALLSSDSLKEAKQEIQRVKQKVYHPKFIETDQSRDQGEGLLILAAIEKIAYPERPMGDCIKSLPKLSHQRCKTLWPDFEKNIAVIKKEVRP